MDNLLVFDVDGTILKRDAYTDQDIDGNKERFKRLSENGVHLVMNTARIWEDIESHYQHAGVQFVISGAGTRIHRDGIEDPEWKEIVEDQRKGADARNVGLDDDIRRIVGNNMVKFKMVTTFYFHVALHERCDAENLGLIADLASAKGCVVLQRGVKIKLLDKFVNKKTALEFVLEKYFFADRDVLGTGDSIIDEMFGRECQKYIAVKAGDEGNTLSAAIEYFDEKHKNALF